MSAVISLHHVIINTKDREMTLPLRYSDDLYRYIAKVIVEKKCVAYAINGIENHIHMFVGLHPTVCLADLVRDIKLSTSHMLKKNLSMYPSFRGWGAEYGSFSYSMRDKDMIVGYIAKQREHHQRQTFEEEYRKDVEDAGLEWNDYRLT